MKNYNHVKFVKNFVPTIFLLYPINYTSIVIVNPENYDLSNFITSEFSKQNLTKLDCFF